MFTRACVVRLDALGDTLLSTPAIRRLTEVCPDVTVLTHPAGTPVLAGLATAVEVPHDVTALALAARLQALAPEVVLCFTEKRRAVEAVWKSGCPIRAGFDPGLSQPLKALFGKLAFTHGFTSPNNPRLDPGLHEVERYGRLLEAVGVDASALGPLHFACDVPRSSGPVALQLTPKWLGDGWTTAWLRALAERLPGPAIGLYGPGEAAWVNESFRGTLPLCLTTSLAEYAARLRGCRLLVTIDTGAAHMASALGVPVVDVFPERNHEHCVRRWRPWQVEHRIVLKPEAAPGREEALTDAILQAVAAAGLQKR